MDDDKQDPKVMHEPPEGSHPILTVHRVPTENSEAIGMFIDCKGSTFSDPVHWGGVLGTVALQIAHSTVEYGVTFTDPENNEVEVTFEMVLDRVIEGFNEAVEDLAEVSGHPCRECRGEGRIVLNVEGDDTEECEHCDGSGVEPGPRRLPSADELAKARLAELDVLGRSAPATRDDESQNAVAARERREALAQEVAAKLGAEQIGFVICMFDAAADDHAVAYFSNADARDAQIVLSVVGERLAEHVASVPPPQERH